MESKDIIKALECCNTEYEDYQCPHCPFLHKGCKKALIQNAMELIKNQQAKIERLKAKCENTQIGYSFAQDDIKRLKKDKYKLQKALNQSEDYRLIAKSEAYKEVLNKLSEEIDEMRRNAPDKDITIIVNVLLSLKRKMNSFVEELTERKEDEK